MDSDRDKKVKRIARFLELGGTMLAEHCKVCGAPKFRYQGTVICPICDVREEGEETPTPEPAAEVQAPEARSSPERDRSSTERDRYPAEQDRSSPERDRSSFEARKKVQARRPKTRFGQRAPDTEGEEDKTLQSAEEEIPEPPYEAEAARRTFPEVQAAPPVRAEKRTEQAMVSTAHGDREVLENLLFEKMVGIAASLQNEKNPRSIAEQLELIEKGIGLIERLRQI
ncbi:Sjogren's syndrome/scleroderma autoantigen 1 family protein [Methanosarcina sp. T3]|uniref:Sjogren's syndrome/scleroderma autoantigen 1 family protein n=1 Tax=Methanosarcina sp. T3 TaxID=3439062 RepID=UPI003F833074